MHVSKSFVTRSTINLFLRTYTTLDGVGGAVNAAEKLSCATDMLLHNIMSSFSWFTAVVMLLLFGFFVREEL